MKKIIITITTALLLTSACSNISETAVNATPKYQTYVSLGQELPISDITSIDQQKINLHEKGKRKLVILFATWCSDSQYTIKQLLASPLVQQDKLTIVGIGREENSEILQKFATDYNVNFPLVSDEKREIYAKFANAGIPRLILVDEDNKIVKTLIGEDPTTIEKVTWDTKA